MLLDNSYTLNLIFNKINLGLKKLFVQRTKSTTTATNFENISSNNERKTNFFIYKSSLEIHILKYRGSSKAIIGFRCLNKLSRFVKAHKDKDHLLLKNNVIYKIFCKNCEATYVGNKQKND